MASSLSHLNPFGVDSHQLDNK
uniref:Uncharacterized protein n=1 Tax=Arundo donax TaxID=35708 RepID=A0A0A9E9F2_ARUDO